MKSTIMKSGANYVLPLKLNHGLQDVDSIQDVFFTLRTQNAEIIKAWHGENNQDVVYSNDLFCILLYQKDTQALVGSVEIEAQINYLGGSIAITKVMNVHIAKAIHNEEVENDSPTVHQKNLEFEIIGSAVVAKVTVRKEDIIEIVNEYMQTHKDDFRGEKGDKGDKGDPFRYSDFTPEQLAGLKGEKGDTGEKGDKGDRGEPFRYSDFTPAQLEGLKGEKGDKGDRGLQGIQGIRGEKGEKGDTGATGQTGATGERGLKGDKGDQGIQGLPGRDGLDGKDGKDGKDGTEDIEITYAEYLALPEDERKDKTFFITDKESQPYHNFGIEITQADYEALTEEEKVGKTFFIIDKEAIGIPKKGVDYWTEEDKQEIIRELFENLPIAEKMIL